MTRMPFPNPPVDIDEALAQSQMLAGDSQPVDALQRLAKAIERFGEDERLLRAAADLWVMLVDRGDLDAEWPAPRRRRFLETMIAQRRCPVSPPILAHRIASQHSSGVAGHVEREAKLLGPVLASMFGKGEDGPSMLVMLLLLRRHLDAPTDERIAARHLAQFAELRHDDLAIPYSVIFEQELFARNVADLRAFGRAERANILGGDLPLGHLLILLWLVPGAFADLPEGWAADAIAARLAKGAIGADEARAARSLLARYDGPKTAALAASLWPGNANGLAAEVERIAVERAALSAPLSGPATRAALRLDQRPRQAVNAARHRITGRAPLLAGLRRRPKVAVCVSGQLRGFGVALDSWRRSFLPAIDATIFINSWRRIGRTSAEPFRYVLPFEGKQFTDLYREIGVALGTETLQRRYPALFAALTMTGEISEAELSALYATPHVHLDDEREAQFQGLTNPEKMHRKIEACFDMVEASGQEFDLILRIRPDKPVTLVGFDWRDMVTATHDRPLIYAETAFGIHYGALMMGDQFAIGAPAASRVYARTASRSPAITRFDLLKHHRALTGHVSLAQNCWLHGIDVRKVPMRFGKLQDPEPLSAIAIRDALKRDSAGRDDRFDKQLIAANAADLAAK